MRRNIKAILAAAIAVASLPISLFCLSCNTGEQYGFEEFTSDPVSTLAISAPLKTEASSVIKVSETYIQTGQYSKNDTNYICLRFSTAIYLGTDSGVTNIRYRRTYETNVSEWKEVTTVYRGIKISNNLTNYYDLENGLTTIDPHNDYYFACYTISIKPASVGAYSNMDFQMEISINGTDAENIVFTSKCSYDTAMLSASNRHVLKKFDLNNNYIRKDVIAKKNTWTKLEDTDVTNNNIKEVVYKNDMYKVRRLDQTYYEIDPLKWNNGSCNGYQDADATSGRGGDYTSKSKAPMFVNIDNRQAVYMSALHIDNALQYNTKSNGNDYGFSEISFNHPLLNAKKVAFDYKYWDVNDDISNDDGITTHAACQFVSGTDCQKEDMPLLNDNSWHTYEATYKKGASKEAVELDNFNLKIYHMTGEMFISNIRYFDVDGKLDGDSSKQLTFIDMQETYYPYNDTIKSYLQNENANVSDYVGGAQIQNQAKAIELEWVNTYNCSSLNFIYSTNSDYSNCSSINLNPNVNSVELYNLLKDETYYAKIVATVSGEEITSETSFKTTNLGPRVLQIDGVYNTRDIGGYRTESGKKTVQGLFYRGGALTPSTDGSYNMVNITDEGKALMRDVLGVKTEMDLRYLKDNLGLTQSPIPNAQLKYYATIGSYLSAFTNPQYFKKVFKDLAKPESYPVYLHCSGGADRTGTVCFLANALLGVSESDLIHDYELTSFSIYGLRNSRPGSVYPFNDFYQQLKDNYQGETLSEKVNSYLLSIGVSQIEINNFKSIMFGEQTQDVPSEPEETICEIDDYLNFGNKTSLTITSLTRGIKAVGYDKFLRVRMKTFCGMHGGIYVLIGSYGIFLRGGEFRTARMSDGQEPVEWEMGLKTNLGSDVFNNGDVDLLLKISPGLDRVNMAMKLVKDNVETYSFEHSSESWKLTTNEITNENAVPAFSFVSGELHGGASMIICKHGETPQEDPVEPEEAICDINDYLNFDNQPSLTITGLTKGIKAIGYGKFLRVRMKTFCGANGGIYVLIGSYGIYLRGGEFRTAKMAEGENPSEVERGLGTNLGNYVFNEGDVDLLLRITPESDKVNMTMKLVKDNAEIYSFEHSSESWKLTNNEITNTNAVPTFSFVSGDDNAGSSMIIYKHVETPQEDPIEPEETICDINDYLNFDNQPSLTITGLTKGIKAIGYGKFLRVRMKTFCGTNGGIYVLIGSYGIYLRGGEFRTAKMAEGENPSEVERGLGTNLGNYVFNEGDIDLLLKITPESDKVNMTMKLVKDDTEIYSFEHSSESWKLTNNEITNTNAVPTFSFVSGDDNAGSSMIIYKY